MPKNATATKANAKATTKTTPKKTTKAPSKTTAKRKATPPPPAPAEKRPTLPGVRPTCTRPYLAGVVIAKHGLAAGITDAMVKELNDLYGKDNDAESYGRLRNAWHVVRGHLGLSEDAIE